MWLTFPPAAVSSLDATQEKLLGACKTPSRIAGVLVSQLLSSAGHATVMT
jgi:hypothetical protein